MARKVKQVEQTVEVVEEVPTTGGMGIDEGIVLITFLLLVGAIALVYAASKHYAP
jgi:hypothetical protein